jgi:Flp pilus assembly protein TadD
MAMAKKLLVLLPLLVVAAFAAWAALRASRPEAEWTTSSPAALAALEAGLEAERKYYGVEARQHFTQALELDPGFVAAKVALVRATPREPGVSPGEAPRDRWLAELAEVDTTTLRPREAFLVEFTLLSADSRRGEANALLQGYLAKHPHDPYALEIQCNRLWDQQRFAEAERAYEELLAVEPNWVRAQNNLGYLAMAQGDFATAKDRFLTYRYVAPDQANPHDSLGELMVLLGRWDEAREELEKALAVREDFCASYGNLVTIGVYTGDLPAARAVLQRAAKVPACRDWLEAQECRLELLERFTSGDAASLGRDFERSCAAKIPGSNWLPYIAALQHGQLDAARQIELRMARGFGESPGARGKAVLAHLAGLRLVAEGKLREGAEQLATADAGLTYFGTEEGLTKLLNRLQWAHTLELLGDTAGAAKVYREVAAVNAPLAESFREGQLARVRVEPLPDRGDAGAAEEPAAAADAPGEQAGAEPTKERASGP